MSLFDWITGRTVEPIDDDSCDSDRSAIRNRLYNLGWIDSNDKPIAPIYLQYDEITPEIITKIRLVVGYEFAYEIPMNGIDRSNIVFLLNLISNQKYSSSVPIGGNP